MDIKAVSPSGGFRPLDLNFEKQDLHVLMITNVEAFSHIVKKWQPVSEGFNAKVEIKHM